MTTQTRIPLPEDLELPARPARRTPFNARPGTAHPPGATLTGGGVNFSVFSEHATDMELLLFESATAPEPFQVISLTDPAHRSFHFWHAFVEGAGPGLHYAYRVNGPGDIGAGHRFDPDKVLIELYTDMDQFIPQLNMCEARPWHEHYPMRPREWRFTELSSWETDFAFDLAQA